MTLQALSSGNRWRFPLAALGGLALAAALPPFGLAGLAWVAPGLWLAAGAGASGRDAFRIGYAGGLAFWLASLHWLLRIPVTGYPILGWVALAAYLAMYPALWLWLAVRWQRVVVCGDHRSSLVAIPVQEMVSLVGGKPWWRNVIWGLAGAALWVALELLRGWLFTGFPWNLTGVSQQELLPLIQLASLTGVYGISFVVTWASLHLFLAACALAAKPGLRHAGLAQLALPIVVVTLILAWGNRRLAEPDHSNATLKLALVQPSVPQTMIWDISENTNRFKKLLALSETALAGKPDLLVWPEAAMPEFTLESFSGITNLLRGRNAWMIFGADDVERDADSDDPEARVSYNAALLLDPEGKVSGLYRKQRLVIFGEYVPLARWLPFLRHLTPIEAGFAAGTRPIPFRLVEPKSKTSVLICFEDTFPALARRAVEADTDFLLNLTNDGWFGESAAHWQHLAAARFRAVENGVPLVRAANNGLTCRVDAHGRVRELFRDTQGNPHGEGILTLELSLPVEPEAVRTFYWRQGDWFAWTCSGLSLVAAIGFGGWGRRRRSGLLPR